MHMYGCIDPYRNRSREHKDKPKNSGHLSNNHATPTTKRVRPSPPPTSPGSPLSVASSQDDDNDQGRVKRPRVDASEAIQNDADQRKDDGRALAYGQRVPTIPSIHHHQYTNNARYPCIHTCIYVSCVCV